MIAGNRSLRIIFILLAIFILTANIMFWVANVEIKRDLFNPIFYNHNLDYIIYYNRTQGAYNFKGFSWFFDIVSEFDPLTNFHNVLKFIDQCRTGYDFKLVPTGLDYIFSLWQLLFSPIYIVVSLIFDLISDVWFFIRVLTMGVFGR